MNDATAQSATVADDVQAAAAAAPADKPSPAPAAGIHGDQPDSPPPGGGTWAWLPGAGWVPVES